jgi:adenosine deaminase
LAGISSDPSSSLAALPKVELHRHLEGSLRLATIHELVEKEGLDLPHAIEQLQPLVQIQPEDLRTPQVFLSKFEPIRRIFRSPAIIQRLVSEVAADAAAENVIYLELQFNPATLAQERGFALRDVMAWVTEAAAAATAQQEIQIGLIACINRHEPVAEGEAVVRTAVDWLEAGVVGLSLAGDELHFPSEPFHPLLREAGEAGLGLTVHAGEWSGAESIRALLDSLPQVRIGHGVHVIEDPDIVRQAIERRAVFEVCPTSNVQSGAVPAGEEHPIGRMVEAGLQVTINTDDPAVSQITLADEYARVIQPGGLSLETVRGTILASAQASFQPAARRRALEARLSSAFFG